MKNKIIFKYLLAGLVFSAAALPFSVSAQDAPSKKVKKTEIAKTVKINGTVVSVVDGKPLSDIGIRIKGVSGSATTDKNGKFTIMAPNKVSILEATYPGFRTYTTFLNGRTSLKVRLEPTDYPSNQQLIRLATGDFEKRYLAQSATTLYADKFQDRALATPEYYMQGQLPGINVTAFNGVPGAGADVVFRAKNSIYGGSRPLYIVDGMEITQFDNPTVSDGAFISNLISVAPNDIEHITILTDASAKAIYGARGGNGVIIIESYKGEKGNSKIDFSATLGTTNLRKNTLPMLSGAEHRNYMLQMALSQYDGNLGDVVKNFNTALFNDPNNTDLYQKYNNNTDWVDRTAQEGLFQDYHFRMQGGDDVSKYSFSLGYLNKEGTTVNTGLDRLSARFNLDYNITERLSFRSALSFSQMNVQQNHQLNSDYNSFLLSMKKSPITTPYIQSIFGVNTPVLEDQDIFGLWNIVGNGTVGQYNGLNNPLAITEGEYANEYSSNAIAARVAFAYNYKDLLFDLSFGLDNRTEQTRIFIPERGFATDVDRYRISTQGYYDNLLVNGELSATYHKRFNYVHDFNAKVGTQILNNELKYRFGQRYNSSNDLFTSLGHGRLDSIDSRKDVWRLLGAYATTNYVYYDRYIVNATVRVDGSSRFGAKNKAIVFPAVGVAWRVDREKFLQNSNVINELKLRTSFGLTGNDNIGNYYGRLLYTPSNYGALGGVAINNLANEELKPEINREMQVGLDLGLWSNRVMLNVNYFNTVNSNMIVFNNVKQVSGLSRAYMNVGENTNKGLEAGLNFNFATGPVQYNLGATVAMVQSEVTDMPEETPYIESVFNEVFAARAQKGHTLGSYYGYQTDGVYKDANALISPYTGKAIVNGKNEYNKNQYADFQAGDMKFVDQNKDGIINEDDKVFLGDPHPDFFGSFNGAIKYKGLKLSALVDYQLGRDIVNGLRYELENQKGYANQTVAVNKRWQKAGDVTDMPRLAYGDPSGNNRFSDRWVEDGSFIRLRNVTLSYDLPTSWVKRAFLQKVSVFVSGENLLTWTKYTGLDPEFNSLNDGLLYGVDAGSVPVSRCYSAGIKIGL